MAHGRVGLGVRLSVSVFLYASVLITTSLLLQVIYTNQHLQLWFLPCLGLLLLPSVVLQLVSAVLLLIEKGDTLTMQSSVSTGILHIFQLGFLWRHLALFREVDPKSRARDFLHLNYLQLLCALTSFLPLLFIQTFLILCYNEYGWQILTAAVTTLASSCFNIASFKTEATDTEIVTCSFSETGLKFVWRLGELISRMLSLVVFTTVYRYWIFLILGLRGLTMLVCLCTSVFSLPQIKDQSKPKRYLTGVITSYIFSFAFINFNSHSHSVLRYAFYYTITFLENLVLLMVWYFHSDKSTGSVHNNIILITCAGSFVFGVASLIIYNKCCRKIPLFDSDAEYIYNSEECINCRLSVCSKHNIKLQRPFSAGWMSQYQKAVANGNYYKNILQDTFIDSDGNSGIDLLLNSSGEHCQIRDTDLESLKTSQTRQTVAVLASGTYTHKRFFDSTSSIAQFTDTDSISSGSGVYDEDWRQKSSDTILSQLSALDALSLNSSRTQLLTDSWDTLLKDDKHLRCHSKQPMKFDILNSLIRKDLDTSFLSDGYTTDHTLESYQLPVTVLAKKRSKPYGHARIESAYSTASDSTDCTICAFIRQNPSSPEETRRKIRVPKRTTDVYRGETRRRKRREYAGCNNAASRSRRHNLSTDQSGSERSYTHKYEKASSTRNRRSKRNAITVSSTSTSDKTVCEWQYQPQCNKLEKSTVSPKPIALSSLPLDKESVHSTFHHETTVARVNQLNRIDINKIDRKRVRETGSDSGDSAFPRHTPTNHTNDSAVARLTPLSAYLAATDVDNDGTSESSCEMII